MHICVSVFSKEKSQHRQWLCKVIWVAACPAIFAPDAWRTCHDGFVFFVLLAKSFLYVLLLKPRLSREIWGMILLDLSAVTRVECHFFVLCLLRLCCGV
jgi:hypothetical protein